jgi:hypothetical protein
MSKRPGIYFNVSRTPKGMWKSSLKFQTSEDGDAITVSGCCMGSWYDSVKRMTRKTRSLLNDPRAAAAMTTIAPFIPGGLGALAALHVVNAVAAAGKQGKLDQIAPKLEDKTLRELARNMQRISEGKAQSLSGGPMLLVEPDRQTRAMLGAMREEREERRAEALERARDVLAWGKRNAKTDEGKRLVARAEKQYRELKAGVS